MTVVKKKQAKRTKKCVIKRKLKFDDYQISLQTSRLKKNYLDKSK